MYAGLTCVPLDHSLSSRDLKSFLFDSAAGIAFCSRKIFQEKIKPCLQEYAVKFIILDSEDIEGPGTASFSVIENIVPDASKIPTVEPQDIASLIYTSGTTAQPKGVLLSHKNFCSNFISIKKLNICSGEDNILSILPLYHTYSFMVSLIVPLLLGAEVTYSSSISPQELNQAIRQAEVTILAGVPQLFSLLHKAIFERIRCIPFILLPLFAPIARMRVRRHLGRKLRLLVSGGARLEPKTCRDLSRLMGIKLIEGYGLTETSPVVTFTPPERIKFGSVGVPIPDVQIKIFNPDTSGIGQVLIKGPNVMQGYFRQPQLTSQVIKDGWFYSGDLGYIDKEGYLILVGREKDVIVLSSGKNIYPEELEAYYSKSLYIKEICILGKPEERFGSLRETLYAVVVPNLEYFQQKNEVDIRGKIRWELENLAKDLPAYEHVMGFTLAKEEFPRTALKKIKRYQVKEKYLEKDFAETSAKEIAICPEDRKLLAQDIAQRIIRYISSQVKKPVYLNSHLEIDLGIDSLSRLELWLGLQVLLKIRIPDEALYGVSTVKEVITKIEDIMSEDTFLREGVEIVKKNWNQILKERPPKGLISKIKIKTGFLDKLLTYIFKGIILFAFRLFWRLKIKGKVNLPSQGPYIICSNHASFLDGFVIFSSIRLNHATNTFFLGLSDILEHPLVRWAIKLARLIPIDPNTNLTEAMQAVSFVLSEGKIVCVFPEGRRSIDINVGEFKKGIGILVKELDARVVPVYIKGSHYSWPRGDLLPRFCPLEIVFGEQMSLGDLKVASLQARGTGLDEYEAIARQLREEILKLAN
jgi:long-chain acyl-CoA synthetase